MNVAVVKYDAGNIFSVLNALRRIGVEPVLTDDARTIAAADRVILPGQGEARSTMDSLRRKGLDRALVALTRPVLGICIGMQLLCDHSDEGDTDCLGVFEAGVKRFVPTEADRKVPCMGWNRLENVGSALMEGTEGAYAYFVHSYYVPLCSHTVATTRYTLPYSAALHKDNFYATQFHPEKSGDVGERIIRNFMEL